VRSILDRNAIALNPRCQCRHVLGNTVSSRSACADGVFELGSQFDGPPLRPRPATSISRSTLPEFGECLHRFPKNAVREVPDKRIASPRRNK
jgi:hypothetical protein